MNKLTQPKYHYISFSNGPYRRYTQKENKGRISEHNQQASQEHSYSHGSYGSLLFDPKWKTKRGFILKRDLDKCRACNSKSNLQVHHRQYHFLVKQNKFQLPWEYDDSLLITLCKSCHGRGHNKFKVPTIHI